MKSKRLLTMLCALLFVFALMPTLTLPAHAAKCPECGGSMSSKVYMQPTCTDQGMKIVSCNSCGYMYEVMTNALGHSYKSSTTATCTSPGTTTYTCKRCGDSYTAKQAALGHSYEEERTEPTCTEDGELLVSCKRCGRRSKHELLPALGHDYEPTEIAPTCTEDGSKTGTCKNCGDEVLEIIPALGHNFGSSETPATCTEDGERSRWCVNCGDTDTEILPATGHSFGEWNTVTTPTLFKEGLAERSCSEGDANESQILPKKKLKESPGAIAAIVAALSGIAVGAVVLAKSAAATAAATATAAADAASLAYVSVQLKTLALYLKETEANHAFLEQLKKRPYLTLKQVPYGDEEALTKLAAEEKPDLLLLSAETPEEPARLMAAVKASYEDAEFSFLDETGLNAAALAALKAEKSIVGWAAVTDGGEKKLVNTILPLYSPKRATGEWTGNATLISDALGLPIVSLLLGAYTVGDDLHDALKNHGISTSEAADLVNDVASLFGLEVFANIAEALRVGADQKTRHDDKKELKA